MKIQRPSEIFTLFLGDLVSFYLALLLAIFVRSGNWPTWLTFSSLAVPFSILFVVWILVFFISDLYGKQTAITRRRLPSILFNAQIINSALAIIFFYFIPYFGVTPKTILFICLIFSFAFIALWRRYLADKTNFGRREKILFLCEGEEIDELKDEFRSNSKYNITVLDNNDLERAKKSASLIVVNDFDGKPDDAEYYKMIFSGVRFISAANLYEEIFDRIPVGVINERWFLENISNQSKLYYDFLKRAFDILVALILGLISLIFYPIVWLAIKLDDKGPIFFAQERVGKNKEVFKIYKFRSMKDDKVTWVGNILRRSRIDELPQLLSVLSGKQSLVGPRPERPDYAEQYRKDIKYYDIRHIISPGLSGWAQIYQENHPHFNIGTEQTREKLSYDLYYIKNRSLWLDIKIALKTLNILIQRKGI